LQRIYYGYWLIAAAFAAQFIAAGMQNYIIGPFMVPMTLELDWTRAEFTLPRTLGQVVMAFTGFYIGARVDRYGARRFMLLGTFVLSASLYALSFVETLFSWIMINGVLLTVGASLLGNLVVNVTLSKWFVDFRGRAVAWAAMGVSFAGVILTPFSSWTIDTYGWRDAWQILSITTLIFVLPPALAMRRRPEDFGLHPDGRSDHDIGQGLGEKAAADFANSLTRSQAVRTSTFYMLVVAFGLFVITIQVMLLQTVPLMTDAGFDRNTAALMITVASVPALLSKPIWGWLIDGSDAKPLASISAAATGISLFVIVYGAQSQSLTILIIGFGLMGIGWGGMIPLQEVIWASFFGRRYLGAVRSAALPLTLLITAGSPIATSYYRDIVGNYDGAILAVGTFNLISAGLIMMLKKPKAQAIE
jgi:sugar phosphate permease